MLDSKHLIMTKITFYGSPVMHASTSSVRKSFSKYGSILIITVFAVVPALAVGVINYFTGLHKNYESYNRQIGFATDSIDTEISNFIADLQQLNDVLVQVGLVQDAADHLTSYIRPAAAGTTIPMDPALFEPEEKKAFDMMKSFVNRFSAVIYMTVASEKNGGILMYPPKDRTAGYDARTRSWYKNCKDSPSDQVLSDLYISSANELSIEITNKIKEENRFKGVFSTSVDLSYLQTLVKNRKIGIDGYMFIADKTGIVIAHPQDEHIIGQSFETLGQDLSDLLTAPDTPLEKTINGMPYIFQSHRSANRNIDWMYIAVIEKREYESIARAMLWNLLLTIGGILLFALAVGYLVSTYFLHPLKRIIGVLYDIAQGEGDLTVRLPISGTAEIAKIGDYFNRTIEKIGDAIQSAKHNTAIMKDVGDELASNMTETASAVNEISANIDGVKRQALTQAASITETAATIEEIVRTIKQLNSSIEIQAASVAQSSSSVEEMVANIASIGQTLGKTDDVIKTLTTATGDGKSTLVTANTVTRKIAEESGSLMEASSVIQHIASQTNLLAMNAAIEAAHAGEAGKGFAVVADEIRKLAEDSASQGKVITTTLKTLTGEIEMLSASSKTVEEKFNAIFNLALQVKEMSASLTQSMREQENGSKKVLTAIQSINTVTIEVQAGSEEILKGGEGVADEMQKLDNLTRVITESMNEMASGAIQINNTVQEVNEITQKNKRSMESLTEAMDKFKV